MIEKLFGGAGLSTQYSILETPFGMNSRARVAICILRVLGREIAEKKASILFFMLEYKENYTEYSILLLSVLLLAAIVASTVRTVFTLCTAAVRTAASSNSCQYRTDSIYTVYC